MPYTTKTKFQVTDDNSMVYSLPQDGWRKGKPMMVNDIAVLIEARHLPKEARAEIAQVILDALNNRFVPKS